MTDPAIYEHGATLGFEGMDFYVGGRAASSVMLRPTSSWPPWSISPTTRSGLDGIEPGS